MYYFKLFIIIFLYSFVGETHGLGNKEDNLKYKDLMVESIKKNDLDQVHFLIESSLFGIEEPVNQYSCNTPLIEAAKNGSFSIIEYLVESGADVHASNHLYNTVLNELVSNLFTSDIKASQMIHYLVASGCDVNFPGEKGKTALMCSFKGNRSNLVECLIDVGADINIRSEDGSTALMYAVEEDNVQAMKILIEKGIDIGATNNLGKDAFIWSIEHGKMRAFNFFINELKVDINQRDLFGATPLMWAVFYHKTNIIQKLIDLGADLNIETTKPIIVNASNLKCSFVPVYKTLKAGSTALTFAKLYGNSGLLQILEQAGATEPNNGLFGFLNFLKK